ncbi:hypothetical protein Tco_0852471 [Tanacetum coccineum]
MAQPTPRAHMGFATKSPTRAAGSLQTATHPRTDPFPGTTRGPPPAVEGDFGRAAPNQVFLNPTHALLARSRITNQPSIPIKLGRPKNGLAKPPALSPDHTTSINFHPYHRSPSKKKIIPTHAAPELPFGVPSLQGGPPPTQIPEIKSATVKCSSKHLRTSATHTPTESSVNDGEQQITVTVDGHKFAIIEASVRRHLQLADVDDLSSLSNTKIFDQLSLMRYLSDNDKLTFKKAQFSPQWRFLIRTILHLYVAPSLKQKLFSNMKIGFSGVHVPLFDTMLLHDQPGQGEGPTPIVESQHTPTASSSSTSQPTTSQPTSSQAPSSHEPTTEPITTTSSPHPQELQIPQTTSSMPYDSPLSGGYTPGSVEGSMKLKELTDLCTKLVARVTSLETELKKTKEVHGKALTKLVKKVKRLEDKLKSTNKRKKAKMVISEEEEDLISEDPSKQGRMEETEYADVKEEYAGVEYDFDLTEQQVTPSKALQVEVQSQETFEAETIRFNDKMKYFKGMSYDQIRPIFEEEYRKLQTLFKKDSEVSKSEKKRVAEEALLQESFKKLRTTQALGSEPFQEQSTEESKELSEEDLKKLLEIVPVEEFKVEALQTKYPIMDWEIHTEDSRKYWKIIRVSNITEAYQSFEDMLKVFDREDLDTLWSLVKEKFRSAEPTEDMERALWVELKRIYEPDKEDTL